MKAKQEAGFSLHNVILTAAQAGRDLAEAKNGREGLLVQMAAGIVECTTLEGAQAVLTAAEEWYKTSPTAAAARKERGITGTGKTGKVLIPGPWRTAKSRALKVFRVQGRTAIAKALESKMPYTSLMGEHKAAVAKDAPARDLRAAQNGKQEVVIARRCRELLAEIAADVTEARKGGFVDMLEACADSLSTVAANLHTALAEQSSKASQSSRLPQAKAQAKPAQAATA